MKIWTAQEWWDKREEIDHDAAGKAFVQAGLPFDYWLNFVPVFFQDVDMLEVQKLALDPPLVVEEEPVSPTIKELAEALVPVVEEKPAPVIVVKPKTKTKTKPKPKTKAAPKTKRRAT